MALLLIALPFLSLSEQLFTSWFLPKLELQTHKAYAVNAETKNRTLYPSHTPTLSRINTAGTRRTITRTATQPEDREVLAPFQDLQ